MAFYENAGARLELSQHVSGTRDGSKGSVGVRGVWHVARDKIALVERRRDDILEWLEDEAPHAAFDQKHLDDRLVRACLLAPRLPGRPDDIIDLLNSVAQKFGSVGRPN